MQIAKYVNDNEKEQTGVTKLSPYEFIKSVRDAVIVCFGALIPQVLEFVKITNFGEYDIFISVAIGALMPLINRFTNLLRVK